MYSSLAFYYMWKFLWSSMQLNFSISTKISPSSSFTVICTPSIPILGNHCFVLCLIVCHFEKVMQMCKYTMWPLETAFLFHSAESPWEPSKFFVFVCSFLLLPHVPLCGMYIVPHSTIFRSGYTILHNHQQCVRDPVGLHCVSIWYCNYFIFIFCSSYWYGLSYHDICIFSSSL